MIRDKHNKVKSFRSKAEHVKLPNEMLLDQQFEKKSGPMREMNMNPPCRYFKYKYCKRFNAMVKKLEEKHRKELDLVACLPSMFLALFFYSLH